MNNVRRNRGKFYKKPILKVIDNLECPACNFPLGTKKSIIISGKKYHNRVRCSQKKVY